MTDVSSVDLQREDEESSERALAIASGRMPLSEGRISDTRKFNNFYSWGMEQHFY